MSVYIAHAVQDEYGNARGGEPGDQTGKEVCTRRWYLNGKGWRVFRPKDPTVAEKIASDAEAAAANPLIGYDQGERNTLYKASEKLGFNCADVNVPCECDCSSLVLVCILYAGVKMTNFNTESEPSALLKSGAFEELTGSEYTESYKKLKRGDILVTAVKGHTAIVISNGDGSVYVPDNVEVIGKSVRVRAGDSVLYKTLGIAHKGDRFPMLGNSASGWYMIEYKGVTAYITNKSKYTKLV